MGIFIGNTEVKPSGIEKIYVGNTLVYESTPVPTADYLCFTANTAGSTISMSASDEGAPSLTLYYSINKTTWNTFTVGTTVVTLTNIGDKVYFKGTNNTLASEFSCNYFTMTGSIAASGDVTTLLNEEGNVYDLSNYNSYTFFGLFAGSGASLISAPILPATTLTNYCYYGMFAECISLATVPTLPATTLAEHCYYLMFYGCTNLTTPPALPAATLANYCYEDMFYGCTSLTTVPELPATTLAYGCYSGMFQNCTSLTTLTALPATTLAVGCYAAMFSGCTSLTTVPTLPSTNLLDQCYKFMFNNCTSLQVSDTQTTESPYAWNIPTTGTFTNTTTYDQNDMFDNCLGTRSSDDMSGAQGESHTYYTQNQPIE